MKGNLRLHMICALSSTTLIFILCWMRLRLRVRGLAPCLAYFTVTGLGQMMITITATSVEYSAGLKLRK